MLLIVSAFFAAYNQFNSNLVTVEDENHNKIVVHRIENNGKVISEIQVINNLYHGKAKDYSPYTGKIIKEGYWYMGKWDKEWKFYNDNDELNSLICFDKGKYL